MRACALPRTPGHAAARLARPRKTAARAAQAGAEGAGQSCRGEPAAHRRQVVVHEQVVGLVVKAWGRGRECAGGLQRWGRHAGLPGAALPVVHAQLRRHTARAGPWSCRQAALAASSLHPQPASAPSPAPAPGAPRPSPHWQMMSVAPLSLHCCTMSRKYCCSCARRASNCSTLLMSTCRPGRVGGCAHDSSRGTCTRARIAGGHRGAMQAPACTTPQAPASPWPLPGGPRLVLGLGLGRLKGAGEDCDLHVMQLLGHLR